MLQLSKQLTLALPWGLQGPTSPRALRFWEEGRKIYANIQKFVSFLLGTNIGEILYLSVSILASLPVPLKALQIIFLNLMSDGCPAVAISKEPADPGIMSVNPRHKKSNIMSVNP